MKASHPTAYFYRDLDCRTKDRRAVKINSEHSFAVSHSVLFNNESIHNNTKFRILRMD